MDLEIMTFNVQQPLGTDWEGRRDKSAVLIAQEHPDVMGTQEAHAYQRDYLVGKNPGYAWFGEGRDGGDNGEGAWILYDKGRFTLDSARSGNFWLSDTPKSPSRFGGAYNRICTYVRLVEKASGRGVHVFNAHLYTQDLTAYRLKSARMIISAVAARQAAQDPFLLIGDFNSPESDTVTKWFKHGADNPLPLRDTYRDFDPNGPVTTGFGTKFDYVYVEKKSAYVTVKAWVVTEPSGASDHMPISSALRIDYPSTALSAAPAGLQRRAALRRTHRADGRTFSGTKPARYPLIP